MPEGSGAASRGPAQAGSGGRSYFEHDADCGRSCA